MFKSPINELAMRKKLLLKNITVLIFLICISFAGISQSALYSAVPVSDGGSANNIGQANTSRNIAIDAQGNIGIVYIGSSGLRFAKSTNRGQSFGSSVQLSTATAGDCEVNVADNGNIYVVYSNGTQISLFISLNGGSNFSGANVIGNGAVPHIASYGSNVYIVPQTGSPVYRNSNNGVGSFSSTNVGSWVFADIQVDKANGDVYLIADNPTLFMYRSTNSGVSFSQVDVSGTVYYSSYAITTGPLGKYIFAGGDGNAGYRIDFSSGSSTFITFGTNAVSQGRTMACDEFGNFVDGYAQAATTMAFRVSNNKGSTFSNPITIANSTTHNIVRNPATQDVVVVYQGTDGKIYQNVYPNLLTGLTISGVSQSYCPGNTASVHYNAVGGILNSGNEFKVQMSDAQRNFENPVTVGSITSTSKSGNINITIPGNISSGSNYRLRVVSTDNQVIGADNGFDIPINPTPSASINVSGPLTFCQNSSVTLTAIGAPPGSSFLWSNNAVSQSITVNQTGNYFVKVTTACGLSSTSSSVAVNVNAAPDATITSSGPLQFCIGSSVTLSVASASGLSYLWKKDGATISGGTGNSITVNTSGVYSVFVNSANGCADNSSVTVKVNPLPSFTIDASSSTINYGSSVTLNANVSSTRTYTIMLANLVNTSNDCGGGSRYGSANQGFKWTDLGGGTVSNVQVKFSVGVECHSGTTHNTALNGAAGPSFSQTPNWCSCTSPTAPRIVTLNFSNPSNYNIGGVNTFAITNSTTALGFFPASTLGNAYAQVIVTYGSGGQLNYNWSPGNLSTNSITVSPATTTTYTLTAYDDIGCQSSVSKTITVTPPPVDFSLNATNASCPSGNDGSVEVSVTGAVGTVEYSIDNNSFVTSHVFSGLHPGNHSVKVKNGPYITQAKNINISANPDHTPPHAHAKNAVLFLNSSGTATLDPSEVDDNSSDDCGIEGVYVSKTDFNASDIGDNEILVTVEDISANESSASATVSVIDSMKPVVHAKNITVYLDGSGHATASAAMVNNGSTDNCGIASYSLSKTSFDCTNAGDNDVTLTVTDVNGNTGAATAKITVMDTLAPAVLTKNVTINLDASGNAVLTAAMIDNGSYDNCGISGYSLSKSSFDCSATGNNSVTLTVTDARGNSSSARATVTVKDITAPTVKTKNISVSLNAGSASISAASVNDGSFDNCGIASMSVTPAAFNCNRLGNNTVTLTVVDVNGNTATGTAIVTVTGSKPSCSITVTPTGNTYTGGVATHLYLGYGPQSLNLEASSVNGSSFSYSWSGSYLSSTSSSSTTFSPNAEGNYTITCTVTNNCGCQVTSTVNICVSDIRVPGNGNADKVYLCHLPPGNSGNPQTLSISTNGVPAHLSNHSGDKLGSCNMSCGYNKTASVVPEVITEEDENGTVELTISPNPFSGTFHLDYFSYSNADATIAIYDLTGKMVSSTVVNGYENELKLGSDLADGVYYLTFTQGAVHKKVKITKTH
jgi:hypothetical protein